MTAEENTGDLARSTAKIVSAYLGHHPLSKSGLTALIADVGQALRDTSAAQPISLSAPKQKAAVSILKSVQDDQLFCLECGVGRKTLKHHLMSHHSLTPKRYRLRWGLEGDYPMVAPEYSRRRSQLARDTGLGRKHSGRNTTAA